MNRIKIRRLSTEFIRDISRDGAKKCIIPGKWLLQSLLVWPDTDSKLVTAFNWVCFINLIIVEIFHASYVILHRADIGNAIIAAATVTTTFECLVRFYIIVFKKPVVNDILSTIWREFWPLSVLSPEKENILTRKCYITLGLTVGCYGPAIICNTIITLWPYLTHNGLVLKSVYPFQWNQTYVYESVYVWQYFTEWYILILVNTFDFFMIPVVMTCAVQFAVLQDVFKNILSEKYFFMIPVVMTCAVQFAVLQDVFKNILSEKSKEQRSMLFGEEISDRKMVLKCLDRSMLFGEEISDRKMVLKCLDHQRMLLRISVQLEEVFRFAILFQFVNSTAALCSSTVVLQVDSSQFMEMLTFATAHMFQLFYYCFVGNELTVQSGNMAAAIYDCNWQLSEDLEFKKGLILMLQRSQRAQTMTAAGIIDLNFESYISGLVRLYIMLTKKKILNEILVKIWKKFWPADTLDPNQEKLLKRRAQIAVLLTSFFLLCSCVSNSQIVGLPYLRSHDMLLKSAFPFDWNELYVYEILYTYQYFLDWYILFIINAFDFFFISLVATCYLQLVIMQEVLKKVLSAESRRHKAKIFGGIGEEIGEKRMLFYCIEQHKLLINICTELENSFNIAIMIQFFVSTCGICASVLMLKVDYSQFVKMLTFAAGHATQLFYYCYVGHELILESGYLSVAIYECDWHLSYDKNFRQALLLMMQRGQKVQCLTAAGVTELNFASFLKIMRLSFSFYTLLNNLLMKNSIQ
ncbi:7tm Odorant receptor [Popillia japonica]|uniref:7tm Odorant receptor n=1 Tax=Popillia japonica TaxID=7064 RepID=A0AAW1IY45_POPJA